MPKNLQHHILYQESHHMVHCVNKFPVVKHKLGISLTESREYASISN